MYAQRYAKTSAWWRVHPRELKVLLATNKGLKYLGYAIYPLLLVLLALFDRHLLIPLLVIPLAGFIVVTILRILVNEARPYEAHDIDPLIQKDTQGKSFPSRHMYSMAVIAMAWLRWCVPVGVVLLALLAVMGWIRVLGGVHYAHDVIAGTVLGLAIGACCFLF